MVAEVWKPIAGYEHYAASDWGRIQNTRTNHILKPWISARGYQYVGLSSYGTVHNKAVHRLIAEAFLGIHNGLEVNHINENKMDNRLVNLEWITHKENLNYGSHNLRMRKTKLSMKLGKPVLQMTLSGQPIKRWYSANESKQAGFNPRHVNECCNHRRKTHGGYKWKYESEAN